jgi:NAD-dependent SIR2 family protein deacetylase
VTLERWLDSADRVLIAAGAGLSAAAGYDYADGARFAELFPALHRKGLLNRYQLIGLPLPPRLLWGYLSVHVDDIRFGAAPNPVYARLREMVGERDHFVLTSNVDGLFARNGFAPERVWTPQGDYGRYQCETPCTRETWPSRPIVSAALESCDASTGETSAVPRARGVGERCS